MPLGLRIGLRSLSRQATKEHKHCPPDPQLYKPIPVQMGQMGDLGTRRPELEPGFGLWDLLGSWEGYCEAGL